MRDSGEVLADLVYTSQGLIINSNTEGDREKIRLEKLDRPNERSSLTFEDGSIALVREHDLPEQGIGMNRAASLLLFNVTRNPTRQAPQ